MRLLLAFLLGALVGACALYVALSERAAREAVAVAPEPATTQSASRPPAPASSAPPARRIASTPPIAQAAAATRSAPQPAPMPGATLAMPLATVRPDQLVDTFNDLRGTDRRHEALDIPAPAGTPVYAVADGRVEKLFTSVPGGLTLYQFDPDARYAYYYAHLQGYADGLAEGQPLRRGQLVGYVGSTGNADPSAPHLHFAVFELGPEKRWWQGTAIDPYPLLGGRPR